MRAQVRLFREADVPACAALHRQAFTLPAHSAHDLDAAYVSYFRQVFLENPQRIEGFGPLVCEEDGRVTGFLAAIPRPLRFKGRPFVALLTSQFVVDPKSKALPAVHLLKACLQGAQDFTFADESNDMSRSLWERVGGRTSLVHSLHFTALIRPARRILEVYRPGPVADSLYRPLVNMVDGVAARLPQSPVRLKKPDALEARPLEPRDLLRYWHECSASVIPDHTEASLRWLLDRVRSLSALHGELDAVSLWAKGGALAGVYAYHVNRRDASPLVLFAAQAAQENHVLEHLLWRAREAGVSSLAGRVPPRHIHAFSRAQCLMSKRPRWMLVHSREDALLNAVQAGDDALAPLDGEWFTHFNYLDPRG